MVIRGSRKLPIKQLDTPPIQKNFVGARRRDADQIGPRVMVFDADRVFGHGICKARFNSSAQASKTLAVNPALSSAHPERL